MLLVRMIKKHSNNLVVTISTTNNHWVAHATVTGLFHSLSFRQEWSHSRLAKTTEFVKVFLYYSLFTILKDVFPICVSPSWSEFHWAFDLPQSHYSACKVLCKKNRTNKSLVNECDFWQRWSFDEMIGFPGGCQRSLQSVGWRFQLGFITSKYFGIKT